MNKDSNIDAFNRIFSILCVCSVTGYMAHVGYEVQDISIIVEKLAYLAGAYIGVKEVGNIIAASKENNQETAK